MSLEISHLREVGVVTYPRVTVPAAKPSAAKPSASPAAAAPAASKKEKGGAAPEAAAAGKKEKGGKEPKPQKNAAPAVSAGPPPAEKTAAELAKMSKEERTQYHQARRAAPAAGGQNATATDEAPQGQMSKAQRRAVQEAQRKVKEDKANTSKEGDELLEELKLQGLTEAQAREVMAELKSGEAADADDDDEEEDVEDLLGSVRKWMSEQPAGEIPELPDFNMKVRFQGHVDSTPPDHLGAILKVVVEGACGACDLKAAKIQPGAIAKALGPLLERWAPIIAGLYSKCPDVLEAIGVVTRTVSETVAATEAPENGRDCAVVGCLMAMRELEDFVEDEDLLVGCRNLEPKSRVLDKFIEFLEDALEEDDDEDDGDD